VTVLLVGVTSSVRDEVVGVLAQVLDRVEVTTP
jgi:hypothetical protein